MDEAAFRELISGRRRGVGATLLRGVLSALSLGYAAGVGLNGLAYRWGLKRSHRAAVPVVSIGNLTTGGTGKTPVVAYVVDRLRELEARPAILSRGYRADETGVNDERRVLDTLCPGVLHLQGRDRVASAETAVREHDANVLVLDDGFQHRRLARDLDVVLVDALVPWGFGHLLPRGLLRERLRALRRADLVVVTRVDQADRSALDVIGETIERHRGRGPDASIAFPPRTLVSSDGTTRDLAELRGVPVTAFCGIGNPEAFRKSLEAGGLVVRHLQPFPDHHHFNATDLESIESDANAHGAAAVLCTEKDLVKVPTPTIGDVPLHAVRIAAEIVTGAPEFNAALAALVRR